MKIGRARTKPTAEPSVPAAGLAPPAGLTGVEARRRLIASGPNETAAPRTAGMLRQILSWLANPLILILLAASVLSAALGQITNALLIGTMVLLSVSLNFLQTYRSHRAVESLRASVAPMATALRDGEWTALPRRELVVGDVVRLAAGDLVPADGRLLEAAHVYVQEAALTGESMPAEKSASGPEAESRVFLGTSVLSGTATAVVTATGRDTRLGDVAVRLATRAPETEFERGTRRFGLLIMRTVVLLILFVLLVSVFRRREPFESLLFAVALAVGLTPEFLPMITSVTLAQGAVRMSRRKVIVKHLETIQNFGSIDVLLSDKTGTLTAAEMSLERCCDAFGGPSKRVLPLARANSAFHTGIRNPLDAALLASAEEMPEESRKLDEIPFDFERRRVSVVMEVAGGSGRVLITKGAPESLLPICVGAEISGHTLPLDAAILRRAEETYRDLSSKGLRVLAVAWRDVPVKPAYGSVDETALTLAGYAAFDDPVLPDAPALLETLRRDGVEVKILTGDSELVARRVCADVGLDAEELVLGADVDRLTDAALGAVAERASVFARVSPGQKNRILLALKRRGHVVGFLGDGVNDAPSLHAADVGISVSSAVEIAREAAEVILLERSLRVLHEGILEGRKSFGNVMKYLLMGTSSNFGNMFSMAVAPLFLPYLPMLPTQILLNNFLYDLAQVTIPTDRVDSTYVRKPQRWNIRVLRDFMLSIGPISSVFDFLTFLVLLTVFQASERLFHTGWFVESLATQTLVLFVIRTAGNPLRSRPSFPLAITTLAVVAVAVLLPFTPAARALGFEPLPAAFLAFLLAVVGAYLVLVELVKRRLLRRPAVSGA
ncbi:MAG TPA: magnesium-translocating P-type ATPase [Thermoanaerobaculia bacterium]|nr:magnesium-translocating P-type ATPase [Thermoanaerobaculia bacterium]